MPAQAAAMPPKASLTSTFPLTDALNEVVCPLQNQDGSSCRKRCLGEKRYRSMQEHIRRAHPEYYLPKLPATKESFELMITSPPHERPAQDPNPNQHHNSNSNSNNLSHHSISHLTQHSDPSGLSPAFNLDAGLNSSFEGYNALGSHDGGYYTAGDAEAATIYSSMQLQQRTSDEYRRGSLIPAASAAAALAQLQYHRGPDSDWGGNDIGQNFYADQHNDLKSNHYHVDPTLDGAFMADHAAADLNDPTAFPTSSGADHTDLMISALASPPDRSAIGLPPMQRSLSSRQHGRPRKSSLTQARIAKHERRKSKELNKRLSGDRKSFTTEPSAAALYGKRWEDLIDAATTATEEEGSRDLTPIPASPYQSPQVQSRTSLPPFALGSQFQSFQASPLNRVLTPPPADSGLDLQPFASVESSLSSGLSHQHHNSADSSGSQFHIMNPNTMDPNSSPMFAAQPVQIYCAGCRTLSVLKDSYACTNCICGLCGNCVEAIISGQSRGRMSMCPRCNGMDSGFKPFQLDLR